MVNSVEAVFENGVLRPLEPLHLGEQEHVRIAVSRASDEDWLDSEFMDSCADDADATITLEQVRAALSTIRGSMDVAIDEDRGSF